MIVHLCTPVRGVRFFQNTKAQLKEYLNTDQYKVFEEKNFFLNILASRKKEYDTVLITAHGADDSIIIPRPLRETINHDTPYERYITIEQTDKFYNDFVFSVACSTALEFGPKAIENGAISFLGYEEVIENIFKIKDLSITHQVRKIYEAIVKRIFVAELSKAFSDFINNFRTVEYLKQNFSFNFEKQLIRLFKMNTDDIWEEYNVRLDKNKWEKEKPKLRMLQLDCIDTINKHMVILGDPNYISLVGLLPTVHLEPDVKKRLCTVDFMNKNYEIAFKQELSKILKLT